MSDALLVVVLLAPLAGVVLALAAAEPADVDRWTTVGCAVAAAGALLLLIVGAHPHVGRVEPDDLALAATTATALLALRLRTSRGPIVAAGVTVATAYLGVATGTAGRAEVVVVLAAAAAMGAASQAERIFVLLVPAALVVGLRAAPALAGTSSGRWVAVALAGSAVVLALVARPLWCAALMPWALVAGVGPVVGTTNAARALAAGAVLALLLGARLAGLLTMPGIAVFVYALADSATWPRVVLAALLFAMAFVVARGAAWDEPFAVRPIDAVALGLGGWLVLRPESWSWLGISDLTAYTEGVTLAAATGLITVVLSTLRRPLPGRSHAQ